MRFRRVFSLEDQPKSSTICLSADSRYRLYINGKYVAFGPSRCYPHYQCIDQHQVAEYLRPGKNLIAVLVYQPGYSHYSYVYREKLGLWVDLEVDQQQILASDSTWLASTDPSFSSEVQRISIYGAGQEIRDLGQAEPWIELAFEENSWESASMIGSEEKEDLPWVHTQTAPLGNLLEKIERPLGVMLKYGPYVPHRDPHQEMRTAFYQSSVEMLGAAEQFDLQLPAVEKGQVLLLCYDLGYSQAGSARIQFQGAQGSEKLLVSYLEKKRDGQLVLSDPSEDCQMRMTDRVELAPGRNTYEPFTPRGGRFLLLGIVGPSLVDLSLDVEFRSRQYPIALTKDVAPTDDGLQRIAEMCWLTLQSCALDGMVDCPWREQAVWVGDSAITAGLLAELCDDALPLRRMLQLASQGATADGLIPGVVVNESVTTSMWTCSFSWVEGLSRYLGLTNDIPFIQESWAVLATMLRKFQDNLDTEGVLHSQPLRRQFLDWANLPHCDPSCIYNLRYLYALQMASSLATQLDQSDDAQTWKDWANSLANSIRQTFCKQGRWFDDIHKTSQSQHVAAFLVLTDLVSREESASLLQEAVNCSLGTGGNNLVLMSPYMHYYLFLALEKLERSEDVLEIIQHRWSVWLDQGARTTWENWEVDFPDGSECHAWSAHPLLFISRYADGAGSLDQQVRFDQRHPSTEDVRAIPGTTQQTMSNK